MHKMTSYLAVLVGAVVVTGVSHMVINQVDNTANTSSIKVGVQQTDSMAIQRLTPIVFSQPLQYVSIPDKSVVIAASSTPKANIVAEPAITSQSTDNQPLYQEAVADNVGSNDAATANVSDELLAKFNKALIATDNMVAQEGAHSSSSASAVPIGDLPERLLAQIPDISYNSHVYSSNSANRSVRLNGRDLRQGSWLDENIEVLEILQNEVILRVGPQSFSLNALSDWTR